MNVISHMDTQENAIFKILCALSVLAASSQTIARLSHQGKVKRFQM